MAKVIQVRLSRDAELLINRLDISVADAIAKGLKLLEYAESGRMALLTPESRNSPEPRVQQIFSVNSIISSKTEPNTTNTGGGGQAMPPPLVVSGPTEGPKSS